MPPGHYIRTEAIRLKMGKSQKGNTNGLKKGHKLSQGEKNGRFKNGTYINWAGYISILMPEHPYCDKRHYVKAHRYCVEACIGRFLEPTEQVHHIDHNKQNNLPENLYLFSTDKEHAKFHGNPYPLKSNIV